MTPDQRARIIERCIIGFYQSKLPNARVMFIDDKVAIAWYEHGRRYETHTTYKEAAAKYEALSDSELMAAVLGSKEEIENE